LEANGISAPFDPMGVQDGAPSADEQEQGLSARGGRGLAEQSEPAGVEEATGETLSFEALEERHFLNGDWAELTALYERRLDAPALRNNGPLRARVLFRLAQTLEERVGDVDGALERYLEVARLDAGFRPAFAQLRRLHAARGRFELALQVAEHEDPLPMRPTERAVFHTEVAELWAEHMDDPGQALEQFDRALACAPDLDAAARGRAEALVSLGRAEEAALTYTELLERTRGAERAPLGVALARLQPSCSNGRAEQNEPHSVSPSPDCSRASSATKNAPSRASDAR
jgi:tetratricopeptide (TPR) repeat protein